MGGSQHWKLTIQSPFSSCQTIFVFPQKFVGIQEHLNILIEILT